MTEPRRALPPENRFSRTAVIAALAGLVVVGGGVAAVNLIGPGSARPPASPTAEASAPGAPASAAPCPASAAIAVDPAHATLATRLVEAYADAAGEGCDPLTVQPLSSADAVANGLGAAKAWLPEDATWQQRAGADGRAELAAAASTPIGWTPLVLVAPKELADAVGAPLAGPTLTDLVALRKTFADHGKPEWGRFKLVLPDSDTTTTGAAGFRSLAFQVSQGEAPPARGDMPTANQAAMAQTQYRIVEEVADPADVLANLATDPADATGLTGAGPRAGITTEAAALGASDVVATYLDQGATGLHVALVQPEPDAAVTAFAEWLGTDAGRAATVAAGLHAGDEAPDRAQRTALGLPETAPAESQALGYADVAVGSQLSKALGVRMSILTALDISGSMNTTVPGTDVRRIELVAQAAAFDWDAWPPGSEIGFMTFNTDAEYRKVITPIVPFINNEAPEWQQAKPMMQSALASIQPSRGTPLYSAVAEAWDFTMAHKKPDKQMRVIVLTDGHQEHAVDSITEAQLLEHLPDDVNAAGIQLVLVALGADADFPSLKRIADASGGQAVWVRDIASYPQVAAQIMAP